MDTTTRPHEPERAAAAGAAVAEPVAASTAVQDTGSAHRLLATLRDLRRFAAESADADEESTFTRLAYRAKRDTLDLVLRLVAEAIPAIEAEALDAGQSSGLPGPGLLVAPGPATPPAAEVPMGDAA